MTVGGTAKLKAMVESRSFPLRIALLIARHLPFCNKYRVRKGNSARLSLTLLKKTKLDLRGKGNVLSVAPGSRLYGCHIHICGNNNKITIGKFCTLQNVELWIEDDGNEIFIGEHTSFAGTTHLACTEGKRIMIGDDCMFSAGISVRTGDSHSITDLNGNRINPAKDVTLGNHVWIGNTVIITKGALISDNSVVGTGSIVTHRFEDSNVILAGNPAKIIKTDISWDRKRLPIKEQL